MTQGPKEIISKGEARARGLKRYYTGKPCPQGHIDERMVSGGGCRTCQKRRLKEYYRNTVRGKTYVSLYNRAYHAAKLAARPEKATFCELCGSLDKPIVYGHDHETGNFRGWICTMCNKALGCIKDDRRTLLNMLRYLNRHDRGAA
jgi:hypothetical protein